MIDYINSILKSTDCVNAFSVNGDQIEIAKIEKAFSDSWILALATDGVTRNLINLSNIVRIEK